MRRTLIICAILGAGLGVMPAGVGLAAGARGAEMTTSLGPPLVCVPFEIGDAKSLPWGEGAFDKKARYANNRLVDDTLGVLKTTESTLVRMETLRRATVYADAGAARELLARLAWIALDIESSPESTQEARARAWYDAGFFAACLWHMGTDLDWKPGWSEGVQGYAWMARAIELEGSDPAMQLGAACAAHPGMRDSKRDLYERHMRAALAGAAPDSPEARSIRTHLEHWGESVGAFSDASRRGE